MILHQAVVIEPETELLLIALYQVKEGAAILIIREGSLAVVATVHQVVARFLGPLTTAWRPRHGNPVLNSTGRTARGPILCTSPYKTKGFVERHHFTVVLCPLLLPL